jgi:hypothetical protein
MPASRKAKRKEAARELSGQDPLSSSLSLAFSEIEERSAKKYHTKCQIEKDVVHAAVKQALEAKAKNCGRMPDKWYTKYVSELKQTPVGCHMVITAEDIRNKVRAMEKAAAADLALVPSVTRHVSPVPPSGGPNILTRDSAKRQPDATSTTALIVSQVSAQVEDSMRCSFGTLCRYPMCEMQTCQRCNDGVVHRLCVPQMIETRLWCAECCRSKGEGDANANSFNLDLLACVLAAAFPPEVVPPPCTDSCTTSGGTR